MLIIIIIIIIIIMKAVYLSLFNDGFATIRWLVLYAFFQCRCEQLLVWLFLAQANVDLGGRKELLTCINQWGLRAFKGLPNTVCKIRAHAMSKDTVYLCLSNIVYIVCLFWKMQTLTTNLSEWMEAILKKVLTIYTIAALTQYI